MPQETVQALLGLHTDASEVLRPQGSCKTANNLDFERPGVAEPRRGFDMYGDGPTKTFPDTNNRAVQVFDASIDGNPRALVGQWSDNRFFYTNQLTGALEDTSLVKAPPAGAAKVRFLQTDAGTYATAEDGVYRIGTSAPTRAGLLPPSITIALPVGAGAGVLPAERSLAYRAVLVRIDGTGRLFQSPPSGRYVLTSDSAPSAGHVSVDVQVELASDARVGDVIALYRSQSPALSDTAGLGLPTDEMFLVASAVLDASNITNGLVGLSDTRQPDQVPILQSNNAPALLYTSPTADGIAQANDPPPVCSDIELYQGHVFFARPRREFLSFFVYPKNSVDNGGTDNITAGDTITVNGTSTVVLTAAAVPTPGTGQFWSSAGIVAFATLTGYSESLGETLVGTVAAAINATSDQHGVYALVAERDSTLTVNLRGGAYHVASPNRRLVLRSLTDQAFSVAFSSSETGANAPFQDESGDLDGRTANSQTEEIGNGLAYSKPDQPEAVPLLNTLRIGANVDVIRIKRVRNSLMILKRDGWFRLTGTDASNFRVQEIDPTLELLAPESLAVLDNELYGLFDQGVMALSETNKRPVSQAIQQTIREALSENDFSARQNLFNFTIGGAYEEDLKYFLGIPVFTEFYPQTVFVYSRRANAWSEWDIQASCIAVDSTKRLLFGQRDKPWINFQRRTYTPQDFSDQRELITINAVNSPTSLDITFANATRAFVPSVGDAIVKDDAFGRDAQGVITSVTSTGGLSYTVEVTAAVGDNPFGYETGNARIHKHIPTRIELNPLYGGAQGIAKSYQEAAFMFAKLQIVEGLAGFATDLSSNEEQVLIDDQWRDGYGFAPWFQDTFAGTQRPGVVMTYVPQDKRRASQIAISWQCKVALAQWRMQGLTLTFTPETEVIKR